MDGVHHQFSRAGPDLGLRHPLLSEIRSGAVLDRLGVCRGLRRVGGKPAHAGGFAAAAAGRRHRADLRLLPGRDGHQAVLRPAGRLAPDRADHRVGLRRHDLLHLRLRQHADADVHLFGRPGAAVRADPETAAVAGKRPRQPRRPARGHRRHPHHRHLCHARARQPGACRRRVLLHPVSPRSTRSRSWC